MNPTTLPHQRRVLLLADATARAVRRTAQAGLAPGVPWDLWWQASGDELVDLVVRGHDAAAELSRRWLPAHADAAGFVPSDPPPALELSDEAVRTSLRTQGPVAARTAIAAGATEVEAIRRLLAGLLGPSRRHVMAGDRRTVEAWTAAQTTRTPVGYRRLIRSGACPFCAMLATRGGVYASRDSAAGVVGREVRRWSRPGRRGPSRIVDRRGQRRRAGRGQHLGEPYHDHCRCTVEPVYGYEDPLPGQPTQEDWDRATAGAVGPEEMRRAWARYWNQRVGG